MPVRDHFGWGAPGLKGLLAPGRVVLVRAAAGEVRSSALLCLAVERLSETLRGGGQPGSTIAYYAGAEDAETSWSRLLCLMTHGTPSTSDKLRKARGILADLDAPVVRGDPWLRSEAVSEEVRLLAGMWTVTEVRDYRRDPGSRPYWPDRSRLEAARDVLDGWRDRLVLAGAPGCGLPRIEEHVGKLRATRRLLAVLVDSPWLGPGAFDPSIDGTPVPLPSLRALAEMAEAPVVVGVVRSAAPGGSPGETDPGFSVVDVAVGSAGDRSSLLLVTTQGTPASIVVFDPRFGIFRPPIPDEFDETVPPGFRGGGS